MFFSAQSSPLSLAGLTSSYVLPALSAFLFCSFLILILYWTTKLINPFSLLLSFPSYHDRPHPRSASNSSTDSSTSTASHMSSASLSNQHPSKPETPSPFLKLVYSNPRLAMTILASRLSISLEGTPASASNFPSPSSSFLPPPTPGAHEFAVKTPATRKQSATKLDKEASKRASGVESENGSTATVEGSTTGSTNVVVNGAINGDKTHGVLNTAISVPLPTSPLPTTPSTPTPGSVLVHRTSLQNGNTTNTVTASSISSSYLEPPASPAPHNNYSSTSASTTPTISQPKLPAEFDEPADLTVDTNVSTYSGMNGPPSRPLSTSLDPSLFSNRPAPPSPALSATTRRLSRTLSNSSRGGGSSSRPTSMGISISRANSLRNKDGSGRAMGSPRDINAFALPSPIALDGNGSSIGFGAGLVGTPTTATMKRLSTLSTNSVASIEEHSEDDDAPRSAIVIPHSSTLESPASMVSPSQAVMDSMDEGHATKRPPKVYIKIRDFGFSADDDRHRGMGDDVPKANRVARVNRKLAMAPSVRARRRESEMSWGSGAGSSASENEGEDDEDWGAASWGWGAPRASHSYGYGAEASSSSTATNSGGASNPDFNRNFMEQDEGFEDGDEDEDVEAEEEQLYPGLYRALYAFEPEGTAEMKLEEDQIVRVVGRGGGVGWAVVVVPETEGNVVVNGGVGVLVAEGAQDGKAVRHALVPESYLEPYMLEGWGGEEGDQTA
ncbi:hypothetical protein BJ165DRAFT_573689 [Panaeolus papilionaceus]|nr:hypothetical protein BJ165DRAFT_573689 [Panaeolus papilionaceus]